MVSVTSGIPQHGIGNEKTPGHLVAGATRRGPSASNPIALSKLWSHFGSPKYYVPHSTKDPKGDHHFDSHPSMG